MPVFNEFNSLLRLSEVEFNNCIIDSLLGFNQLQIGHVRVKDSDVKELISFNNVTSGSVLLRNITSLKTIDKSFNSNSGDANIAIIGIEELTTLDHF